MPDLITLTCPTCGAKLKVTDQIHLLACRNCGNEFMVHRDAGSIYLAPLAQDVRQIRVGVDKTAAELAVARLTGEVRALESDLIRAEAMKADDWVPPSGPETFATRAALPVLGLAIVLLVTSNFNYMCLALIGFFVCLITLLVLERQRSQKIRKVKIHTLSQLESELSRKRNQLQKNRDIAES